jgi:tetratricopeptide (TPR) repeat protein
MKHLINLSILIFVLSCTEKPYGEHQIMVSENDQLLTVEKIELIEDRLGDLNDDNILSAVAVLYERNKEWDQAYTAMQEAIKLSPLNPSYHTKKAVYAFELGLYETAYEETNIARELGYTNYQQDILLARLALTVGDSSASSMMENVVAKYPQHPTVKYLSAVLYLQQGDSLRAYDLFEQSLAIDRNDEEVMLAFAELLIDVDSMAYAERIYTELNNSSGDAMKYANELGDFYVSTNRYDTAVYFYKYLNRNTSDSVALIGIIDIYWELADYDSVIVYATASTAQLSSPNYGYLNIARALDKKTYYDSALLTYTRLYETDTTDSLVASEMVSLQRKIAYLQRQRDLQRILADSLSRTLPVLTF